MKEKIKKLKKIKEEIDFHIETEKPINWEEISNNLGMVIDSFDQRPKNPPGSTK